MNIERLNIDGFYFEKLSNVDFKNLENDWQFLLNKSGEDQLFLSWIWQYTWWENWSHTRGLELLLIACKDDGGNLLGLAPFYKISVSIFDRIQINQIHFIGSSWGLSTTVRTEYLDLIIQEDNGDDIRHAFLKYIFKFIDFDQLILADIRTDSKTIKLIQELDICSNTYTRSVDKDLVTYIDTNENFDEYKQSLGRHTRYKAFNSRKKLINMSRVTINDANSSNIHEYFAQLNMLHNIRWHKDCFDNHSLNFHIKIANYYSKLDDLKLTRIVCDSQPVSIIYNIKVNNREYNIQSSYDEFLSKNMSLGSIHLGYSIENAFNDLDVDYYDLLAGKGKHTYYKSHYSKYSINLITLQITKISKLKYIYKLGDLCPNSFKNYIRNIARKKLVFNDKLPVILLDCEERSQEGVIQSLGKNNIPIIALSKNKDCISFHSKYVKSRFVTPNIDMDERKYIDFLLKLKKPGVLLFSNDVSALCISKYQEELIDAGYLINLPSYGLISKIFDKWELYKIAKILDISVANTAHIKTIGDVEQVWSKFKKPVILKGTTLAGGIYQKFETLEELPNAFNQINKVLSADVYSSRKSKLILQEWLEYDTHDIWCCETVYDKNSKSMGFFTIRKIRTSFNDDGTFGSRLYAGKYEYNPEIISIVKKLLDNVKWKGIAHVDLLYVPSKMKYYLTEVNPRLPGFSYYPCKVGFDMAHLYYLSNLDTKVEYIESFSDSIYFETFRIPGDFSDGLLNIIKGHITLKSFMNSYVELLFSKQTKVVDFFKTDDFILTLLHAKNNVKYVIRKSLQYIKRKYFHFYSKNKNNDRLQ